MGRLPLGFDCLEHGYANSQAGPSGGSRLERLLCHEKLSVRFLMLFSLGAIVFILAWVLSYYLLPEGLLHGTDSFSIPIPGRMKPSLAVFRRAGPYETTAYILVAAATYCLSLYRGQRLFPSQSEPILPRPEFCPAHADCIGMCLPVIVRIAADAWEAQGIVAW